MADAPAKTPPEEADAPAAAGPTHAWKGTALGLVASAIMLVATLWVIVQFLHHRPLDLSAPTHEVATIAQGVLKNLGASPELIEVAEPHLEMTPYAHFYRTSITAHLPGSADPDYAVDAIERAMLRNRIVISSEDIGETERTAYLSFEGNEVADIRLVHAPVHAKPAHSGHAEPAHTLEAPVAPQLLRPVEPEHPHDAPLDEHAQPPAEADPHHSAAPPAKIHPDGVSVPAGLYAPAFGEIAEGARAKVAQAHTRLAIIVDDGGYGGESTEIILGLNTGLTFSILPNTPHGTTLAEDAARKGFEIMLHMPMDNDSATLTHPGQITVDMDAAKIQSLTHDALAQVPGAVGINNHTGSKFTADATALRYFMEGIKDSGLFFVDSRTTPDSVACDIAREFRIPAAARTLFLDHDNDEAAIRARFHELIQDARAQGSAIGICHFRPNTAVVLRDMLPLLQSEGIDLVHASELVR